jgi:hypothetical protein
VQSGYKRRIPRLAVVGIYRSVVGRGLDERIDEELEASL